MTRTISVCHRPNCNHCPTVQADPNGIDVIIRNDRQGVLQVVQMTKAEFFAMCETKVTDL